MTAEYRPIEYGKDYDVVNNPDKFQLYIILKTDIDKMQDLKMLIYLCSKNERKEHLMENNRP